MAATARKSIEDRQRQQELEESPRPWRTHYSGGAMHIGACKTPVKAAVHAYEHILLGDTTNAQVVGPDNKERYRLYWTSSGVQTWHPEDLFGRPKVAPPKPKKPKAEKSTPAKAPTKKKVFAAKSNHLKRVK